MPRPPARTPATISGGKPGGGRALRGEGPQPFRSGPGHPLEGVGAPGNMDGQGTGGGTLEGSRPPSGRSLASRGVRTTRLPRLAPRPSVRTGRVAVPSPGRRPGPRCPRGRRPAAETPLDPREGYDGRNASFGGGGGNPVRRTEER